MASSLGNAANTLQNSLNTVMGGVNSALGGIPGFGDRATIPTITINTSSLSNVSPPDSWSGPLNELNKKLTLDDLRAALAISHSTRSVAKSTAFSEVASSFNAAQLPLSAVRTVQFCNNVDDIGRPLVRIAETTALVLLGLVIAFAIGSALVEWYRFRQVQKLSRTYANSGQTPPLLEELRFPPSSLPTRTFLPSTPSSSRVSALAHPGSLQGFSSCSPRPATRSGG